MDATTPPQAARQPWGVVDVEAEGWDGKHHFRIQITVEPRSPAAKHFEYYRKYQRLLDGYYAVSSPRGKIGEVYILWRPRFLP